MAVTKYKKYYTLMTTQNEALFAQFRKVHDAYSLDKKTHVAAFNTIGFDVVDTIRFWERKLCAGMERGAHNVYSNKLADKFWEEVRSEYPLIDLVGVKDAN